MDMPKGPQRRDTQVSFEGTPDRLRDERGAETMASEVTERNAVPQTVLNPADEMNRDGRTDDLSSVR